MVAAKNTSPVTKSTKYFGVFDIPPPNRRGEQRIPCSTLDLTYWSQANNGEQSEGPEQHDDLVRISLKRFEMVRTVAMRKAKQAFATLVGRDEEDPLVMFHLGRLLSESALAGFQIIEKSHEPDRGAKAPHLK